MNYVTPGVGSFEVDTSLLAHIRTRRIPKAGSDEGEICSRREKNKERSLFEDHRGIECYSSSSPHRASPRAHL